jgi:gliding motility-associated lipoprotein GldD
MSRIPILMASLLFLAAGCSEEVALSPKPRAYPRIHYPEVTLADFRLEECPLSFQYPDYMEVRQETEFFDGAPPHACWFDLHMEAFNADLHCTYSPVRNYTEFQMLVQDAFRLANEQNKRASYIEDFQIRLPEGVSGMAFSLEGPSASPFQFFLTDSTRHFLRGSLYFNTRPNPDSLAPIVNFVKKDIVRIMETLRWE